MNKTNAFDFEIRVLRAVNYLFGRSGSPVTKKQLREHLRVLRFGNMLNALVAAGQLELLDGGYVLTDEGTIRLVG